MNYLKQHGTRRTPQSESIPGSDQVPNSAGGYAWEMDDWGRLERFLILGSEGGTYYIGQRELTRENADVVFRCIKVDGERTVNAIVEISESGRAPKNDPALFALAACASLGDLATRRRALDRLPHVARISTHLFHFAAYVETFRGWGRALRKGIAAWYEREDLNALAYQVVKYRQRDDWSHRDLLRLAHPHAPTREHANLYNWICRGGEHQEWVKIAAELPSIVEGFEKAQRSPNVSTTAGLIREFRLPREALKTEHLTDPMVWQALVDTNMPMHALVRNLATMTRIGLLTPFSEATKQVIEQLSRPEQIQKSRLHPIAVLAAWMTYQAGHGMRSSNTWTPVPQIMDALERAFYLSFGNVSPTGKNVMLAIDVSGSMSSNWSGYVAGVEGLTPHIAATCMAMVTARCEETYAIIGFARELRNLNVTAGMTLGEAMRVTNDNSGGGTDCAQPMLVAMDQNLPIDGFIIYTDHETWFGAIHPAQALKEYRRTTGREDAKSAVVGMTSNGFSIADPNDSGMLDVVGFDTAAPAVLSDFIRGE